MKRRGNTPKKIRLSKEAEGADRRNPDFALEWLEFLVESPDLFGSLKEALGDSPWSLKDFRRYAKEDLEFAQVLEEAELLGAATPPPSSLRYTKITEQGERSVMSSESPGFIHGEDQD